MLRAAKERGARGEQGRGKGKGKCSVLSARKAGEREKVKEERGKRLPNHYLELGDEQVSM